MIGDDKDIKILYEQWFKSLENDFENEEIKNAFYAGFNSAFKQMMYLMEIVDSFTASDSINSKN